MAGRPRMPIAQRFWEKVIVGIPDECWVWTGTTAGPGRYGHFHVSGGDNPNRVRQYAHRWAYEERFGPIPDGLTIDHLCRNKLCVNPAHLEPVTLAVNIARTTGIKHGPYDVGTHCQHGHARTPENTSINAYGYRVCRVCNRIATAKSKQKRRLSTIN